MRIVQLLPTISFGDAVSNNTCAIYDILKNQGYKTDIYAEIIDSRLPSGTALPVDQMPVLSDEDILIYHASTGTQLNYKLPEMGGKKVMIYHNITPPEFFSPYSQAAARLTKSGIDGIRFLADKVDYCIADSEFNKQDLLLMGYTCPIDVCPILIPFSDYEKAPNKKVLKKYRNDGYTNILFVGRIAPNKKYEDIIRAFYCYQKQYNPKARLFLVGSWVGMEKYYQRLKKYISLLDIEDRVIFSGRIKFDEILAYYHLADAFLCMSEHEGFCVPLVEAMFFHVPILAYSCTAISDTLGDAGLLIEEKTPELAAAMLNHLITDVPMQQYLTKKQEEKLAMLSYDSVRELMMSCLQKMIH